MRIPFTRIYRAFPELDRFSDEQCRRFVRAACRTGARRFVHRAALGALLLVLYVVTSPLAGLCMDLAERSLGPRTPREALSFLASVTGLIAVLAAPVLLTFLVRDHLLIRRIRDILQAGGVCPACRYSLIGLPVSESNIIVCPECGSPYEVDPALGELSTDAEGRSRFNPGVVTSRVGFWTPARRRVVRRVFLAAASTLGAGVPMGWGGYELFLHHQAGVAQRERPGPQGLRAWVDAHQPAGLAESEPNAFDLFGRADLLRGQADAGVLPSPPERAPDGREIYPDFTLISDPRKPDPEARPERVAYGDACRRLALACLDAYEEQGVFAALDTIKTARRAERDLPLGAAQPLMSMPLPDLGSARAFARVNGARMAIAREHHDLDTFIDAFEASLALARMIDHQPVLIDGLVALTIQHTAIDQAETVLADRPDAEWVEAIQSAFERQDDPLPRDYHIEGDRILALDAIAWAFSDPGRVRFGKYRGAARRFAMGPLAAGRLGTYAENRDALNAYFASARIAATTEPYQRRPLAPFPAGRLVLMDELLPGLQGAITTFDQSEVDRRGLRTLLALERYRLAHASYPTTLDDLVPEFLPEAPIDPWTGQPLCYRRLDDGQRPGFRLYAAGIDGVDDNGTFDKSEPTRGARSPGMGLDYPIGRPAPRPPGER